MFSILNKAFILLLCFGFLIAVLWVALAAIPFPFELEWFESAALNMVERVYTGKPVYTEPSLEYIPLVYNPLHVYLAGYLAKLLTLSLPTIRSISFVAFVLTLSSMFWFLRRETRRNLIGLIATGYYAATFQLSGAWYHLARVDSLFVLFLFTGIMLLYIAQRHWQTLLAACLLFLAFLTKQTLVLYLPFLTLYLLVAKPRQLISFLPVMGILIGATILIGNALTDGLYYFYVFAFQPQRGFKIKHIIEYIQKFSIPVLVLSLFAISSSWYIRKTSPIQFRRHFFYVYITLSSFAITFTALSQAGGYYNNMMPSYLWLAMLIGINMHTILHTLETSPRAQTVWAALLCLPLCVMIYNPLQYIPKEEDYAAGQQIVELLETLPEPVWIPQTTSYYFVAHRKPYAHYMTIWDTRRCGREAYRQRINQQIEEAIEQRLFSAVILGSRMGGFQELLLKQGYRQETLFSGGSALYMKTGMHFRPEEIYYRE